ncbi:MAG: hypothetical protein V1855_01925 [bacterium]
MEKTTFNLEIISPEIAEKMDIEWIEIESPTGSFLVGPNHSTLISIIKKKSIIVYQKKATLEKIAIDASGGIFSVHNNHAIILLDR